MTFPELLRSIASIDGEFLIRFMTSHPKDVSDELISVMSEYSPKVAPYFHLPLQSGSSRVLEAMNRTYDKEKFLDTAFKLKERVPNIALSTDVIIGFPGETDEDFEDTLDVLSRVRFDLVYSFLFSPRVGTPAENMTGQVSREIMNERMSRLLSLQDGISLERSRRYENLDMRVLIDSYSLRDGKGILSGRTDTNKLVFLEGDESLVGKMVWAHIDRARAFDLFGTIIKK
jgi:tRNA-2-methylthio-N6-dimethylallyladenosine synthase